MRKLPLLTKDTIRHSGSALLARNASQYHPVPCWTSGTSGEPLQFFLDKESNLLEFGYYWRHWSWAGFKLGDCFAELGSQYFMGRDILDTSIYMWQPLLRRLMLNSSQISVHQVPKMADAIWQYKPKFLKGMASALYFTALSFQEAGITDLSFKAVFSTGEVLTPQYRATTESVFNCRVLDSYGHMERTVAISECLQGGYHVNSDYGILEFDTTRSSSDGKRMLHRAVGTSLYNRAMPLIRYDVGDDIEVFSDARSCPCGRSLPLVKAVHGRSDDTIVTPDGRFITSIFILPEFVKGIDFVQFVQESEKDLHIRVVPGKEWDDSREDKLMTYARKMVGSEMRIHLVRVSSDDIITDRSGKRRSVISRVKCVVT